MIPWWGTVIIAVAGVAGTVGGAVVGSWLTGKSHTQALRQQLAFQAKQDKRRIYATALCSLDQAWSARATKEHHPSDRAEADYRRSLTEASMSASEVRLVGSKQLRLLAADAIKALAKPSKADGGELAAPYTAMLAAMREDLGEPD